MRGEGARRMRCKRCTDAGNEVMKEEGVLRCRGHPLVPCDVKKGEKMDGVSINHSSSGSVGPGPL